MINNNVHLFQKYLGDEKINLLDIGARYGIHERWGPISSILKVVAFEPDKMECDRVNDQAKNLSYELECLPYALGNLVNQKASLNLCKDLGCSSIYKPNIDFINQFYFSPSMAVTGSIDIVINKLDEINSSLNLTSDIIKIDTQGYELEILKGSVDILKNTQLVELEVEFNEQYKDQPLFSDVDKFMRENGYSLLGLRRTYWRRKSSLDHPASPFGGQIMHGDAIYYNEKLLNETSSQKIIMKFCVLFSLYKQDDFISYLLTKPHIALSSISGSERKRLIKVFQNSPTGFAAIISSFLDMIRKKIWLPHTTLRRVLDKCQSKNSHDWHDPDFF